LIEVSLISSEAISNLKKWRRSSRYP